MERREPSRFEVPTILGLGHSHLTALEFAVTAARQTNPSSFGDVRFIQLLRADLRPVVVHTDGTARLNPALQDTLAEQLSKSGSSPLIALSMSGNEYHFIGMFNHPRPYDFVLPEAPDLPLIAGAELLPEPLLAERFRRQLRPVATLVELLKAAIGPAARMCAFHSPPPISDSNFIARKRITFAAEILKYGVSPSNLRYKLWRLQTRMFDIMWKDADITCLPPPEAALDPRGFMVPPGWHDDGVHATPWYGALVLRQLQAFATGGEIS